MDLIKIGRYIAGKRKQLGMTQRELAEKLGMSDKSVSKWERGICLPDVSVYSELCTILGISINEFLAGEDIPHENIAQKTEENILGVVKDSEQKQRSLKIVLCAVIALFALCAGLLAYTNRPYKPISFVADGEGYSAEVINGDTLVLQLDNANGDREWYSVMAPEFYTCVSMNAADEYTEFRIRALSEGKGDMGFLCIGEDGNKENYILTLSISRHRKAFLQIDSISFGEYKSN